jgi:hypothetical protein
VTFSLMIPFITFFMQCRHYIHVIERSYRDNINGRRASSRERLQITYTRPTILVYMKCTVTRASRMSSGDTTICGTYSSGNFLTPRRKSYYWTLKHGFFHASCRAQLLGTILQHV